MSIQVYPLMIRRSVVNEGAVIDHAVPLASDVYSGMVTWHGGHQYAAISAEKQHKCSLKYGVYK